MDFYNYAQREADFYREVDTLVQPQQNTTVKLSTLADGETFMFPTGRNKCTYIGIENTLFCVYYAYRIEDGKTQLTEFDTNVVRLTP